MPIPSVAICLLLSVIYYISPVKAGRISTEPALSAALNGIRTDSLLPADTLTAGVREWDHLKWQKTKYGERREVLHGSTRDLSMLDITAHTLSKGQSLPLPDDKARESDELVIVRDGMFTITIGSQRKELGPGGVALLAAGEAPGIVNTGSSDATCYLFRFQSRLPMDKDRARQAGGPFLIDWKEMVMKPTAKGEGRQIVSKPMAWLGKIDLHATTLNPGEVSHPPHIHRAEEIILLRSGHVQMYIGGQHYPASGGDLVFLASGVPHALENNSDARCEYFALQWQQ